MLEGIHDEITGAPPPDPESAVRHTVGAPPLRTSHIHCYSGCLTHAVVITHTGIERER